MLFILNPGGSSASQDLLGASVTFAEDPSTFLNWIVGAWTATEDSAVPEPGALGMMLSGVLAAVATKAAQRTRARRPRCLV